MIEILKKCPLFAGLNESSMRTLLDCLSATRRQYEKHSFIFKADDKVTAVGIVLTGSVRVVQEDFWGNRTILAHIDSGGLFGEAFSCAEVERLPVSVIAAGKTDILLIDYRKIVTTCSSACAFHARLIANMLKILAVKNVQLTRKMEYLTRRTTRDKLLSYLSAQALQAKSDTFQIPFNRQELADYLCVERSAMSAELGRMRDEGLLTFEKNSFCLTG